MKETNMSMDEMNDGFEAWKQQLDSMNKINMALGIKKLNLEKVFKNDYLKKNAEFGLKLLLFLILFANWLVQSY